MSICAMPWLHRSADSASMIALMTEGGASLSPMPKRPSSSVMRTITVSRVPSNSVASCGPIASGMTSTDLMGLMGPALSPRPFCGPPP